MPFDFTIDAANGIVISKASGVVTYAEVLGHMDRLRHHPEFRPTFNQFLDLHEVTDIAISADEIREIATQTVFAPGSHRAFLATSGLKFGISRMYETYRRIHGEDGIRIFTDVKEARSWASVPEESPKSQT